MIGLIFSFAAGVWWLQQQAELPDLSRAAALLILALAIFLPQQKYWQGVRRGVFLVLTFGLGFFFAAAIAQSRLADSLPAAWQGEDIDLVGIVAEMPMQHERGQRFSFTVERTETVGAKVPAHILLATYANEKYPPPIVHAGERWHVTVRLKQPHGSANPYNFDFEAWALERDFRAVGYVHGKGDNRLLDRQPFAWRYGVEQLRETIRGNFKKTLGEAPMAGVLIALAIGDQASISASQWQTFTRTGVNHLMSISGLHITLFSSLIFALSYFLWRRSSRLTLWLPARKAAAVLGVLAALAYTLISGYSVPAQRTLYMLSTVAALLLSSRNASPLQFLSAALLVVLLLDPWAVMAPGFWLSFGAVALIFYVSAHRIKVPDSAEKNKLLSKTKRWLAEYGRLQWAMSIGLIPPLLAIFQQVSLVSPLANFFAIPLVSFGVVPLTLLGSIPALDFCLYPAQWLMEMCFIGLRWLENSPMPVWTQHAPPTWSILLGSIGVLWILLPRGFPSRWLGWLMLLPMFLVTPKPPEANTAKIQIFDVGQGLAVSVQTAKHALLFDAGPDFNSEANSGNRILIPALRGMGVAQLDTLVLSHNDTDHIGGASGILQGMPVAEILSSLADNHPLLAGNERHTACQDGQKWEWDGVHFELLHPDNAWLQTLSKNKNNDNNHSCVLRVFTGKQQLLLTGDAEAISEHNMLALHAEQLPSSIVVVPHHGSKSSSSEEFVAATQPKFAIFSAGYLNHFGHPKAEIVERYQAIGSQILRTDQTGAIEILMTNDSLTLERYRDSHRRYWQ